jgi:hypothetical protein
MIRSQSYIEGYRVGFYDGGFVWDNPYVPAEGEYDYNTWELGRLRGRLDWREGLRPLYHYAEN